MDYRVGWSAKAWSDVEQIETYIAKDSSYQASKVALKIIESSRSLDKFPERGRVLPDQSDENLREIFVYSYRMIYEIEGDQVTILAVIHGSRLLEATGRFE